MLAETKFVRSQSSERSMADCQIDYGARSDVGRVREINEDSLRMAPDLCLFVLSDGMGGQASGEVASGLATESIMAHCREAESNPFLPLVGEPIPGLSESSDRLASAIRCANLEIRQAALKNPEWRGMGATVVAVKLAGERMSLAHVGDSRAYRLRSGELEQLTQDHSFVAEQVRRGILTREEAEQSKLQNVLLRALGAEAELDIDVEEELLLEGDTVLLCSDGLTRELSDAQIAAVLKNADEAQAAANRLIDLANQAGGEDNISVIVLRRAAKSARAFRRIGRWFKGSQGKS
jgi:PPM family protein phosphatase